MCFFHRLAASFNGQGWSWHKGLPACGSTHLSLIFKTQSPVGTLLYNGPIPNTATADVTDFMLLEVVEGKLKLYINFGSGVRTLQLGQQVIFNILKESDPLINHASAICKVQLYVKDIFKICRLMTIKNIT